MQTLDQFIATWNEKSNDYDKNGSPQCVDIVNEYIQDVLGLERIPGNAIDLWSNSNASEYQKIGNAPNNFPVRGDILIFKSTADDPYGHCSIVVIADVMHLTTFDQNWGSDKKCHEIPHDYSLVLGWLHPISADNAQKKAQIIAQIKSLLDTL